MLAVVILNEVVKLRLQTSRRMKSFPLTAVTVMKRFIVAAMPILAKVFTYLSLIIHIRYGVLNACIIVLDTQNDSQHVFNIVSDNLSDSQVCVEHTQ